MRSTEKEDPASGFLINGDPAEFDPERWLPGKLPQRHDETGVNVLVVGAGLAGLMTALECWRKGHNVVGILERSQGPVYAGDIIIISPSAISAIRHWPDMIRELEEDRHDSKVYYHRHSGELILGPTTFGFDEMMHDDGFPIVAPHQVRKKFYRMLLRQVARVGLRVEYSQRVEKYFEDQQGTLGGIITESGVIRVADVVVAADANKSSSDLLISGQQSPAHSAGMSVFRAALPTDCAMQSQSFRERWGDSVARGEISHEFWAGPGIHLGLMVSQDFTAFGFTPRDSSVHVNGLPPVESWNPDVDPQALLEILKRFAGWHPAIMGLVENTPAKSIIQWPLLWRNLNKQWTSKYGRVVQVGEAAHSSIPASASGGTLAIEDAVTLASCLQLSCIDAGARGVSLGTRVYNLLRYERVSCSQRMAFVNAELLGDANMDDISEDPNKIRVRLPKWLFEHEPETYAYTKYGQAVGHILCGSVFRNTNLPPGHKFVPWTIEQVHQEIRAGKKIVDLLDGDWS